MASSIASLFGPSAEEIVYDRDQQERLRQQAQLQQSLAGQETQAAKDFYQSGYNIAMGVGKGLAGAFGYSEQMTDPRIAKSLAMRKAFSNLSAEDLNDPSKIAMISQLADEYDLPELKVWTANRERELLEEESTRQKRINDANKVTIKGAGNYKIPGNPDPVFGYMVGDQIIIRDTGLPAPKNTTKYIDPKDPGYAGKQEVDAVRLTLKNIDGLGDELSATDLERVSNDIGNRARVLRDDGMDQRLAVEQAIGEYVDQGKFTNKELPWYKLKAFSKELEYNPQGSAKQTTTRQSEAQPEAQQQTKSVEELSKMYDPTKLVQDTLDGSIWLVDDKGDPIKKVSD
jgi:hypothetical protein